MKAETVLKNAQIRHDVKLKTHSDGKDGKVFFVKKSDLLSLIRYSMHIGRNEGFKEGLSIVKSRPVKDTF